MDNRGVIRLFGQSCNSRRQLRIRDDRHDTRLGSENQNLASEEEHDDGQPERRRYIRHTPQQIQELEAFFNDCQHPDEEQRMELSRRLNMEAKQVKYWFQNRRTQMKTLYNRNETILLKGEHERLLFEYSLMKEAMRNPVCNVCGSSASLSDLVSEEHQLKVENTLLKDKLNRISALAHRVLGRPISPSDIGTSAMPIASLPELAVGRDGFGSLNSVGTTLSMGRTFRDLVSSTTPTLTTSALRIGMSTDNSSMDVCSLIETALSAMKELMKMAQPDNVLWTINTEGKVRLNLEEYMKNFLTCNGIKPDGFVTGACKESGIVNISSLALVETVMNVTRWIKLFPCLVAKANTIEIISSGVSGSKNGGLQVMDAEFQVLSHLVPVRRERFLRYCKKQAEGMWAVVDVSINTIQDGQSTNTIVNSRRFPSGFVVEDMPDGCSKVTWVEHSEYDENAIHHLYRPLVNSGLGFGAQRWIATLQRQCEALASTMPSQNPTVINHDGRQSILLLAQRMMDNFYSGIHPSIGKWDKIYAGCVGGDVQMLMRKSIGDPSEPSGVLLSATISLWLPVLRQQVFEYLRNMHLRRDWEILSNNGHIEEVLHIANGQQHRNCISLFRLDEVNESNRNVMIFQETWTDDSASVLVYAPVDKKSMNAVMDGGDSSYAALLPSGIAIYPDGSGNRSKQIGTMDQRESQSTNGCLLTFCLQFQVNNEPSGQVTMESIARIYKLIKWTIEKIKVGVQAE